MADETKGADAAPARAGETPAQAASFPLPLVMGVFTENEELLEEAGESELPDADSVAAEPNDASEEDEELADLDGLADELGIARPAPEEPTRAPEAPYVPPAFVPRALDARRQKALVRARMRQERDVIPPADHARGSEAVCRKVLGLPAVKEGATVALYRPLGSELALAPLVRASAGTLRLAAPVTLTEGRMEFVSVTQAELLACRRNQPAFLAHPGRALDALPEGRTPIPAEELDVILVPGVAFDRTCRRLGYGGGYYDAYLARKELRALVVGLAFDEQVTLRPLPAEEHDRRMDAVITPTEEIWA